ncbi:MAG: penicillin-binding transpeptidase domain-containing protein, partial [Acidobacteriota bacterium]
PPGEHALARSQMARLRIPPRSTRPEAALHAVLRFADHRPAIGSPIVDTTLDLELQRDVTWQAQRVLEGWQRRGAGNVAVLVVERGDGVPTVRAAVSSADYFAADGAGSIDYLRVRRSSGSTLKPFLFAQALDRGVVRPTTILDDLERGAGGITNADNRFLGPMLPRFALGNSRNVPAANLLAAIGLDEGWAMLGQLGLAQGHRSPERYGLGLTIGSLAVSLEDLVQAYGALADDGVLHQLHWLADQPSVPGRRIFGESSARQVTRFLADPQARLPSFPRQGATEYGYPVAVKTGTSSRYRDAWTVAWSSRWMVGVWVGHPDNRPMTGLSGYRTAAALVHGVMDHLHPDASQGLADVGFPQPDGHREVAVCALSGRRAGPACGRVAAEALTSEAERATPPCSVHRLAAIDRRSGRLADHRTPRQEIELRAFTELPARYADWQARAGLPYPPRPAGIEAFGVGGEVPVRSPIETRLTITSPEGDVHLLIDPETPAALSSVALAVDADPPPPQILWRVNGRPFALADPPFRIRWPLDVGDHVVVAEDPRTGARSAPVRIRVE